MRRVDQFEERRERNEGCSVLGVEAGRRFLLDQGALFYLLGVRRYRLN
jgi:hypothetical protein